MTNVTSELEATAIAHDAEAKRKILNRLRRAQGQLAAVIGAVEQEAHCRDVVQQLAAVSKALDRAGFLVISSALKECLSDPQSDHSSDQEELEKLFLSLA
jgi:DNA-binding FrmR family transcriptional regulator